MTRHQAETELYDIRREIARLQRREAAIAAQVTAQAEAEVARPGWPMRRAPVAVLAHATGAMISVSEPARTAV